MAIKVEEVETFAGRYQIERDSETGEITAIVGICSNCGVQWDSGEEGIAAYNAGWIPWLCERCTEELRIRL